MKLIHLGLHRTGQPIGSAFTACLLAYWLGTCVVAAAEPVNFNREVRPILNRYCTSCHGGVKQAGEISFIYRDRVLDSGILIPGDPDNSELMRRVRSEDPEERMPPVAKHPEPLSDKEIQILQAWIEQGAAWGNHWSLEAPHDPGVPDTKSSTWPRQSIDHWILQRLQQEGLSPATEAEPGEWLRRVTFDLTGLPPTVAEFEQLIAACANRPGEREQIYAATVDRLLESPHFGERWAAMWMDLARYADSMGFEKDPHRDMWPYRNWLIDAFNADMPYDEFTIKQLAGDLLPEGDARNLVATAFHRNTQTNTEGGTDDEEFRVAAVIDRVNSTWTVWQATTFGCVQCHSHPYDPYRNEEYYAFMAFFNNTEDYDLDDDFPTISLPADAATAQQAIDIDRQAKITRQQINAMGTDLAARIDDWQHLAATRLESSHGSLAYASDHQIRAGIGTYPPGTVYTIEATATALTALRLQLLPENDDPAKWPETGAVVSQFELAWRLPNGEEQPIELADVFADSLAGPYDPTDSLRDGEAGFGGYPKLLGPRWAVYVLAAPVTPPDGATLIARLHQDAQTSGSRSVYVRRFALEVSQDPRWTELAKSPDRVSAWAEVDRLKAERAKLSGAKLPVIQQRHDAAARPTYRFIRGNWLDHGQQVTANTPAVLPKMESDNPKRLDLAHWIVSPRNPLTARVWVNRVWAELFGIGIVETLEDFGSTGTTPTHPELLDHLALRLQQQHAWHLKPMLREWVMSATYRQSNKTRPELLERDPRNQWLAHGPRTRLTAEMVRDQALVVSGLLTRTVGGPSVMPPQPDGIWRTVYNSNQWTTAAGPDRYRRAVYTYWRRTSPYPSTLMFDAPSREFCSARRVATNTPLQALVTLNDPVYVECAQKLAGRAREVAKDDHASAVAWMYRDICQQIPSDATRQQLLTLYATAKADYLHETTSEKQALGADADEFALTLVANTLMNLDRAVIK